MSAKHTGFNLQNFNLQSFNLQNWAGRSGLENLRAVLSGDLPMSDPMVETLNIKLVSARHGECIYEGTPLEMHLNPRGIVHGGWAMAVLDTASALAVYSALPKGKLCATAKIDISLIKPIMAGMKCRAIGALKSAKNDTGLAKTRLTERKTGQILAVADCKVKIFDS